MICSPIGLLFRNLDLLRIVHQLKTHINDIQLLLCTSFINSPVGGGVELSNVFGWVGYSFSVRPSDIAE